MTASAEEARCGWLHEPVTASAYRLLKRQQLAPKRPFSIANLYGSEEWRSSARQGRSCGVGTLHLEMLSLHAAPMTVLEFLPTTARTGCVPADLAHRLRFLKALALQR